MTGGRRARQNIWQTPIYHTVRHKTKRRLIHHQMSACLTAYHVLQK